MKIYILFSVQFFFVDITNIIRHWENEDECLFHLRLLFKAMYHKAFLSHISGRIRNIHKAGSINCQRGGLLQFML